MQLGPSGKCSSILEEKYEKDLDILKAIDKDVVRAKSYLSLLRNIRKELYRNQASYKDCQDESSNILCSAPVNRRKRPKRIRRKLQPKSSIYFKPETARPKRGSKPENRARIRDIPGFLEHARVQKMRLTSMEDMARTTLEARQQEIAQSRLKILELYDQAKVRIGILRKHLRKLSSFAEDLSRLGRMKTLESDDLLTGLTLFEHQRKYLMEAMTDPEWARPHCFYMFAIEHFRGNKQAHLTELAEAIPGNLAITAVANHSIQRFNQTFEKYEEVSTDRTLLEEKLKLVTKKREICRAHLRDYYKMLLVMKNKLSKRERKKIKDAEKEWSVGQPLIVNPQAMSSPEGSLNKRRRSIDFRRNLLRTTGVVERKKTNFLSTWRDTDIKEYVSRVDGFLSDSRSNAIASSTTLKELDLSASLRNVLGMPMFSNNFESLASGKFSKPEEKEIPLENHNRRLNLPANAPTTATAQSEETNSVSYPYKVCERRTSDPLRHKTALYNRDWSVLADILKNISNAHKNYEECCTHLTSIIERREALKLEIGKLKTEIQKNESTKPQARKHNQSKSIRYVKSEPLFFPENSSYPISAVSEKASSEQADDCLSGSHSLEEKCSLFAQPERKVQNHEIV